MKIVFSTDQIYLHGGIEKVMATKANYFADEMSYNVTILTCEQRGIKPCYPLSPKIQLVDLGINYQREKSYFSPGNLFKLPFHFYKLHRVLRKLEPDAVIVCNYGFDYYGIPFLYTKAKKIKEFHGSRYFEAIARNKNQSILKKLYYRFNDWIESKYNHLIVLNKDEVPYYKSGTVAVIPNPISIPDTVAPLNTKLVVAAGRISPVKGFDQLIHAWNIVHSRAPEWELHIYGEDYVGTQKKLEFLIDENKLEKTIYFKGSSANMMQTFEVYSLYALSSVTECFPMVLLESLAVGLPIVSFDCPNGPRNIIANGEDGLLAENQNTEDLAEKMLFLMQNYEMRQLFGQNAKRNSAQFSTAVIMKRWLAVLHSETILD